MFPNSRLMRNLIGYLLLYGKDQKDVHIVRRCFNTDLYDCKKDQVLKSASEILGAGAVACCRTAFDCDKFLISSCQNMLHSGIEPLKHLQRRLHQEPWNYGARYMLVLNYLQKTRIERFPPLMCTTVKRLTDVAISNLAYLKQDTTNEYKKFQLLLCAAEVCLQCQNHVGCITYAKSASALHLPDFCLFYAHLLLCRAYAVEDNVVSLKKEYMICLQIKTQFLVGSMCLKLIGYQYNLDTDGPVIDSIPEICFKDVKNSRNMWLAIDNLVQGFNAIRRDNFVAAEEFIAESCLLAGDEACLFFCHGVICMELAKLEADSRIISVSIRSLKKATAIAGRPLPIVSLLLARGEASFGSKNKWEKYLKDEWFSWQQELRPAEIYFQMHLLSTQQNSLNSFSSSMESLKNPPSRMILKAIHLNPSCSRYWTVLLNLFAQ